MADVHHAPEYYLAKAEEHPLLGEVIEGKTTFRSRLEGIVAEAEIHGGFREDEKGAYGTISWEKVAGEYDQITAALAACGEQGYEQDVVLAYLSALCEPQILPRLTGGMAALSALALVGGLFPPFTPFIVAMGALGGGCSVLLGSGAVQEKKLRQRGDEILVPLYTAADAADADIRRCFPAERPAESFRPLSESEEGAYRRMDADGRKAIEEDLRRRLVIGALDMGEVELDRYLKGLDEKREERPWWWGSETPGGGRLD